MKKIKGFRKINSSKVNDKINNLYIHLSLLLFTLYKPHKTTYKIRTFKNNPIQKRTVIS